MSKNFLIINILAALVLGAGAMMAQGPANPPSGNQSQVQNREKNPSSQAAANQSQAGQQARQKPDPNGNNHGAGKTAGPQQARKAGPNDGTGNLGSRPVNGTGYGSASIHRNDPLRGGAASQPGGARGGSGGRGRR